MRTGRSKSKYVGMRLSEEESQALSLLQQSSSLSKSEILVRGLELLSEYYSLGLDHPPLSIELRNLETEAMRHAEALKQIKKKEEATRQMVQELQSVDRIVDKYQGSKNALIQILLDIQEQNHWLPKPALIWVAERLGVTWSQIYNIASFYKAFSLVPQGRHLVQVCLGTACQVRGGPRLLDRVIDVLNIKPGETDQEQRFTLTTVNCLGCCAIGPVVVVDDVYYSQPTAKEFEQVVDACE
ncbi:complex I 24 kDa subunit family protein [Chloroflexota bacterium]